LFTYEFKGVNVSGSGQVKTTCEDKFDESSAHGDEPKLNKDEDQNCIGWGGKKS
jgi:hypothetical protein